MYQSWGGLARQTGQFRRHILQITVSIGQIVRSTRNPPVAPVTKMRVVSDVDMMSGLNEM
jgi:hypothetical protein